MTDPIKNSQVGMTLEEALNQPEAQQIFVKVIRGILNPDPDESEALLIPDIAIASNPNIKLNDGPRHVVRGETKYARVIRAENS